MSLTSWIGNWLRGPPELGAELPREDSTFTPSFEEILQARDLLRFKVPTELADIILHMAEYYYTIHHTMDQPLQIVDRRTYHADRPIISVPLPDDPHYPNIRELLVKASLVIKGHDQGWSQYLEDKGTKNNSWTWYTMGINDPQTHHVRLATNLHAIAETQTHSFEWDRESEEMEILRSGETLEIWAHARYPGWVNHVEYAELSIAFSPL